MRRLLTLIAVSVLLIAVPALAAGPAHLGHHEAEGEESAAAPADSAGADEALEGGDWDITVPRGPHEELSFTVDEGTWLSVDVHPDGDRLVFDLLGDLYTLPIAGGEATRITDGMAWDFQPRWAPDGSRLIFTSDRSGGDEIHFANADGSGVEALSDTGEKDTNSGAISPDGQWVATKRRFTDGSSIGTTELWLFHVEGGSGIQVTKKEELAEVGSPAFGPEGRFLYFEARGSRFRYNRNPHQGIYDIRRFDRETGEMSVVARRHGGAARPSLSPDGKWLSYVSRDGLDTILVLHELRSGAERVLRRDLSKDQQESFAWTGPYPGMSFTPDSRHIVLWAAGKLWKVAVADGSRSEIPFTAPVTQTVQEALHYNPDVTSDTLRLKILRWVHQRQTDGPVVFSAVGRLYATDADGSGLRRLPRDDDDGRFEYAPRLSPDGKRLAWVDWSDADKGRVRVGRADGSGARTVSDRPGQWANPRWSPDGETLAVLRGSGATLRGGDLGEEIFHEIWLVPAEGGDMEYVCSVPSLGAARRMPTPMFGPQGKRIHFLQDGEDNHAELHSVRLDGSDRVVHAKVKYGEEFALSPNGQWLAYKRLHDAYLAPLPPRGDGTVELGDSDGAVKVVKLSDGLADWVGWVDDRTVSWAAGPEYFTQTLDKALAPAPEEDEEDEDSGEESEEEAEDPNAPTSVELVVELPRARPSGTLVLQGATLITMGEQGVVEDGTIIVRDHRIEYAGSRAKAELPAGAKVVDVSGLYAMPGLVDAHAHMGYGGMDILPQNDWRYAANLAWGVTTTMDPSASTHLVFAQSEMVEAGLMVGPRIQSTGFILYGADIHGRAPIESLDDARAHVRRMKTLGATAVKSYMQPLRRQRQWVLQAAREESLLVFPEGGGNFEHNLGMIVDGHTGIEHAISVAPLYEDVLQLWAGTGVGYTPTLLVAYGGISGENWFYQHEPPVWSNEKLLRFTPRHVLESRARRLDLMAGDGDWHHIRVSESATELARRGVMVNLGAHGQLQGLGPHWELWALAQGGMTPMEALEAATVDPAYYIGMEHEIGKLEAGMLADIVLLGANPLDDIRHTDRVRHVVKNGELFEGDTLNRQWPVERGLGVFPWQ